MWRLQYHPPNTSVSIFHRHPRPPTPLSSHIMPGTGRLSGELQQSCQRAAGACAVVLPATAGQATVFWLKKRRSPVRLARGKLRRQRAGWSSRVHGGSASTSAHSRRKGNDKSFCDGTGSRLPPIRRRRTLFFPSETIALRRRSSRTHQSVLEAYTAYDSSISCS